MDNQPDAKVQTDPHEPIALGQASKLTKGSSLFYPYFEASPPPFDRYCPTC